MSNFDQIIGYEREKKELKQVADILKNSDAYKQLGASSPKGLLLYGEPGVGKTLMANALIAESGRKIFVCRKDRPNGAFVKSIKSTFVQAAEQAPSIVFLDDMDKFANGDSNHQDAEEYVTVQSCIDEYKSADVFVLATVNNIGKLPKSLLRAGRFDRILKVNVPHGQEAIQIISHYLKQKNFVAEIDEKNIARIMNGRSCAELETVVNEAGLCAGYERARKITMKHFLQACLKMIFQVSLELTDGIEKPAGQHTGDEKYEEKRKKIAYHEAGHAVVSEILIPGSVTLVCMHSQEGRAGGFVSYYDDDTHDGLQMGSVAVVRCLAGMAAIEQKFGVVDSGTESDLNQAFRMVGDMIADHCSCGFQFHSIDYRYSEDLQARKEQAAACEMERYYRKAKEILACNTVLLEKVAQALLKKDLLTMADLEELKRGCVLVSAAI